MRASSSGQAVAAERPSGGALALISSVGLVFALAILANKLNIWGNIPFGRQVLEYPLWAALLGLIVNLVISATKVRDRINQGFRTEFFLKTGLVLMGVTVNFSQIMSIGAKGVVQALIMISAVFAFTWFVAKLFGLDDKLRALMSTSVAICGVSAAIAAAGAVVARREHLAYVTTLVILFALPLMVFMPWAAKELNLATDIAGAWIGGNIDTTAAVVGAGAVHSEAAMKTATIVKMSQNALIGIAAFLLALYWVMVVERKPDRKPSPMEIWRRFPKFVLGFAAASIIVSLGLLSNAEVVALTNLRNWFLTMAFVSIGLEFAFGEIGKLGGRPLLVYFLATVFNTILGLFVAMAIFGGALGI
ncbi:MAG: putative sulfate exporter family transporter [Chloroflexi bacterium]|nr:putative sulfate exporter family transporter [Chloroflexota bacterium]